MYQDELRKPFFVLAPMDDVTDTVFRQIISSCAKPDISFTEFVNVDGLQSPGRPKLIHKLKLTEKEKPVIAQVWGLKPENYQKTAREIANGVLVAEANTSVTQTKGSGAVQGIGESHNDTYGNVLGASTGADDAAMPAERGGMAGLASQQANALLTFAGVDINMGCPVKTVIKNGACAALINNKDLAGQIIDAVRQGAGDDFPVSVKTRLGFNEVDLSWIEFLLSKKLNMLTIHGRTAKQMSKVLADWDLIGEVVKLRDKISPDTLIVGNGDVLSRAQGVELAKKYNLDGIMIGRGIFHDPFIFSDKSPWEGYSKDRKLELFKKHIELHIATYTGGERKFELLRKFCKVYINGFDGAAELRASFMETSSPVAALDILSKH